MCGLAGVFERRGRRVDRPVMERMAAAIAHRGPDGEGFLLDNNFALAFRRLAILDLTAAADQPMNTPDGRFVLAYNGEVYNFRDLRRELGNLGVRFRSQGDTEVVLQALVHWGAAALKRFNGMFALAFWDRAERKLLLARDRYGIKPLYWAETGDTVLFASEIKALLTHPSCPAALDPEGLIEYLTFQNFLGQRTLFRNVRIVAPGTTLSFDERTREATSSRYWDFAFAEPESPAPDAEYAEELARLFRQAVTRQLVSDVPVGSFLSGGIDTASIATIASAETPGLPTFTVGFDMPDGEGGAAGLDERPAAAAMAAHLGTRHHARAVGPDDLARVLPAAVRHIEEPRVGQSYPNSVAAALASESVKVVLSGTGGDELFGGYPWRYYRAVTNESFENYIDKYYVYWQRLIANRDLRKVLAPIWSQVSHVWTRDLFRDVFGRHADALTRPEDYINHSLYFEARTFLHGLLVVEDKLSMAHGLEVRLPFLDNDLVDFAMTVPVRLKLGNLGDVVRLNENEPGPKTRRYFEQTQDGKLLLRQVMGRYIPKEVAERRKQGFTAPDAAWFRGESAAFVRSRLIRPDARIYNYLDRVEVQRMVNQHLDGESNRRLLIWSLLYLEEWLGSFAVA